MDGRKGQLVTNPSPLASQVLAPEDAAFARQMLAAIAEANRCNTSESPTPAVFEQLLDALLSLTESEFGFVAEVLRDEAGQPYLKTHAISNIAWSDRWRAWYEQNASSGLEFRNLDTLFGEVLRSGEAMITNRASRHPKAGGTPPGHPELRSFMGVPIHVGAELVGVVGVANRRSGYSSDLPTALEPLSSTIGQLLRAHQRAVRNARGDADLRAREERNTFALASSGDGVFDWDLLTGSSYLSPGWKAMLGYDDAELTSSFQVWRERIHPRDLADATRALELHLAGAAPSFSSEHRLRHRDGSWRWMRVRGRVVASTPEGRPARLVGTQTDITDSRLAEEALVVAKVEAMAAARAKSEFLAVVSHELRTPLNAVNGMATLLGDTPLDNLQRDYVSTLKMSSDALLTTLNDILNLAALDAGKVKLDERVYDPRALVTEVLYNTRDSALAKGLCLQYNGPVEPSWLLGDVRATRQILAHLVSNALKFTEHGWVNVTATTDPGVVVFRVEDSGIGIPEDQLARVFEPFAPLHPSFTRGPGESGLGLAICKRLVELMGGDIRVESSEGQGSVFEVTIPASAAEGPTRPTAALRNVDEGIDAELRERQPCVLVAEDNPVNQKVARAFLEKLGVRVDCVGNGLEAVTAVTRFPYDMVLMDCQMPVMDGYTATQHLRALNGSVREIPVVALTADALDSARERCFAVGMNRFLTKPLQLPALRHALYETLLLGRRGESRTPSLPTSARSNVLGRL